MERKAVGILRGEMEASGQASMTMGSLSIKVKWGQDDLKDLGTLRQFLTKYEEVFITEGSIVRLAVPSTEAKAAPLAPQASKAVAAPVPSMSKGTAPPPVPKKRGPGDMDDDGPEAKVARTDPWQGEGAAPKRPGAVLAASKAGPGRGASPEAPSKAGRWDGAPARVPPGRTGAASATEGVEPQDVEANGHFPSQGPGRRPEVLAAPKVAPSLKAPSQAPKVPSQGPPEWARKHNGEGAISKTASVPAPKKPSPAVPSAVVASKGAGPGRVPPPSKAAVRRWEAPAWAEGADAAADWQADAAEKPDPVPMQSMPGGKSAPPRPASKAVAVKVIEAKGSVKRPFEAAMQARRPWEEDALGTEDLSRVIAGCKTWGIEHELAALAQRLVPSDEYKRSCQRCLSLLRAAASTQWGSQKGAPVLELVGSLAQGTELDGADMDVAVRLAPGLPDEARDRCAKELREQLQSAQNQAHFVVTDTLQLFPHAQSPVAVELRGAKPRVIAHLLLAEQPANERPMSVDSVIKQLCDTYPPSRDLLRLVKLWAVTHGLGNQQEGYMNGAAWAFLAVFFLQKEKLVPALAALAHGPVQPATTRPPLTSLLRGFFDFVASRDGNTQRGLSVTHAQEYRAPAGIIFLEDPAEFHETRQQRNLAASVGEVQWARVLEEARKAAERLGARPQRWFHWAEVFDPRELPVDKLTRLPSLAQAAQAAAAVRGGPAPESKVPMPPGRLQAPAVVGKGAAGPPQALGKGLGPCGARRF